MSLPDPLPELTVQTFAWTVGQWVHRDDAGDHLDLHAPYQRDSVWTDDQRRNLIKSLLMRLPVGAVTYAKVDFDPERPALTYRVIDGKQRIEAVRAWATGELSVPGWWFRYEFLKDPADRAGDVYVHQLSTLGRRHIEGAHLGGMEYDSGTEYIRPEGGAGLWSRRKRTAAEAERAEAEVYLLVNFGGVEQTDEDRERASAIAGVRA